jgi:hypothetical protein
MIRFTLFGAASKYVWVDSRSVVSFVQNHHVNDTLSTELSLRNGETVSVNETPENIMKALNGWEYREPNQEKLEALHDALQGDLETGVSWMNDEKAAEFAKLYPRITAALRSLLEDLHG